MYVPFRIACVLVGLTSTARGEHDHAVVHHADASVFGAGVAVVAAAFDTVTYAGNYQGIAPSVSWSKSRFAAGATSAVYRLEENGARFYGLGDLHAHSEAILIGDAATHAGVIAAASAPIGDRQHGLGMGHVMLMPAAFGSWSFDPVRLSAMAGYSRAVGGDTDHEHGPWPLVEPMLLSELSWSAGGDVAIAHAVHGGARISGGIPIGSGDNRVVGTVRVGWHAGRIDSAAELQAGLAGDPFIVRGVVSTALSF